MIVEIAVVSVVVDKYVNYSNLQFRCENVKTYRQITLKRLYCTQLKKWTLLSIIDLQRSVPHFQGFFRSTLACLDYQSKNQSIRSTSPVLVF